MEQTEEQVKDEAKKLIKAIAFTISVNDSASVEKKLKSNVFTKTYSKFQLLIANWLKLELASEKTYEYAFRIDYKGKSLRKDDILINMDGRVFVVLRTMQRMALIVTAKPEANEPTIFGTFRVLVRKKQLTK
jgi:hypothetical protein